MPPIQSRSRLQIRQSIGYLLGDMVLVTASATGDTSSLIALYSLAKGGDDEYNGRQLYAATMTGSIAAGEKSWVSDFASATSDATVAPVFSASVGKDDVFELWKVFTVEEINDAIDQAFSEVTDDCLQVKQTYNTWTASAKFEYDVLSSYVSLHRVEYVNTIGTEKTIHKCNAVWDELVDADVTVSLEASLIKEGSGALKLVVAAGAGAGDILATEDISSTDLTECTELEIWIYSTVALDAGDIQVLLDDTAQCASPTESLDIPATTANTWTRHIISLGAPQDDSAIISVGLKMVVDKGAFTLYADDIKAVDPLTREWLTLNPDYWRIVKNSTNYLQLSKQGLSVTGNPTQIRLTGFQIPSLLTTDSSSSEIDPQWVIDRVVGRLLLTHAKSSRLDIADRAQKSKMLLEATERRLPHIRTSPAMNTRWVV